VQEAENRRIAGPSQTGQIVLETLSQKHPSHKRTAGVARGIDPDFSTENKTKLLSYPLLQ
jgi:hypothetical protein